MRRAGVVLLALAVGAASAQGWPGTATFLTQGLPPSTGAVARQVTQIALPTALTRTEIANLAAAGSVRRSVAVQVGSRAFLGTAVLGGSLIVGALTWFYEEAQRAANPTLDGWYYDEGTPGGDFAVRVAVYNSGTLTSLAKVFVVYSLHPTAGPYVQSEYPCPNCNAGTLTALGWSNAETVIAAAYSGALEPWGDPTRYCSGGSTGCDSIVIAGSNRSTRLYLSASAGRPALVDFLVANPEQADALRDEVLAPYLEENVTEDGDPHTMPYPWQGVDVQIDPPLTWPVWTQEPYADAPDADTDDDGWPDWIEWRLGTDPFNPGSRPLPGSDPDGDGRTNEQERVAVTDPLDGTEYDANQTPGADPNAEPVARDLEAVTEAIQQLEAELAELLAGVAQESQQIVQVAYAEAQLQELVAIREALEAEEEAPVLEAPDLAELDDGPWTALVATTTAAVDDLRTTAATRLPFALESFVPTPTITGSTECAAVSMPILGVSQSVGLCDTPVHGFMAGPGRAVLLALAVVAFWLSAASVLAKS